MNRTEEQLETLIQELSAHHGDDSFAIVNDIVRANPTLQDVEIFALVASILGGEAYVRVPIVLRRPQSTELPHQNGNGRPQALHENLPSGHPVVLPATSVIPTYPIHNPFQILDPSQERPILFKPVESVWKSVVSEHQANSRPENPLVHDPNIDTHFEDVDMDALEDVDPVAFEMARNPDFFSPVPTISDHQNILVDSDDTKDLTSHAMVGIESIETQLKFSGAKLASQTLLLDDEDHTQSPSSQIPSFLLGSLQPRTSTPVSNVSSSSVASDPSSRLQIVVNPYESSSPSTSQGLPSISSSSMATGSSSSQLNFWLPPPPSTDDEMRQLKERLAHGFNASLNVRGSSNWSASGEYAIAPSPSMLRQSLNSPLDASIHENPPIMIDLTGSDSEELDTEALDFLGQIFPDFEPSYLADCLRGANNDVQLVSDFLMPVLMEEIEIDTDFNSEPYDYSQHMHDPSEELPQFEIPSYLLKHQFLARDDIEEIENDDSIEFIEIEDDETLPEEDSAFNKNYQELVEWFPTVNRDWVLDALLDTENDLFRAADLLARGVTPETIDIPDENGKSRPNDDHRQRRPTRRGRRNGANKVVVRLGAPNAWARPLAIDEGSGVPLSEYPMLKAINGDEGMQRPIRIRPAQQRSEFGPVPRGMTKERTYGSLMLKRMVETGEDSEETAPRYISTEERGESTSANWARLTVQANQLFEQSSGNARSAVAVFSKNRSASVHMVSRLQAANVSWITKIAEAGRLFYIADIPRLDLHGLRLRPASQLVSAILQAHWEHGSSQRSLDIITGRGAHSIDGISRIKEDIRRQVAEYDHIWVNPGCVRVLLPKPRTM
jgi:hypothetical protein